jgi:hypothetical protein
VGAGIRGGSSLSASLSCFLDDFQDIDKISDDGGFAAIPA